MKLLPVNSQRGLDWLSFFVANLQAAFGTFIAVYLTEEHWTQGQIGFVLTIGTVTSMVAQVPAGMLVDHVRNKHRVAFMSILAVIASCLILATFPNQLPVAFAEVLHGLASCTLNPAIQAITLSVIAAKVIKVGEEAAKGALGERFGRNGSFASVGNAIASGLMGLAGYYISASATFILGALMAVPGLIALSMIERVQPSNDISVSAVAEGELPPHPKGTIFTLLSDKKLLGFAVCVVFYHLANNAMLPIAAGQVTKEAGRMATLVIAACVLLPQLVGALLAPIIGRLAETVGRRPVMFVTFAAVPLRGLLLSMTTDPYMLVVIQLLDGISSPAFGVMMPLVAADLTRKSGRFNLCVGILGLAMGAGASLSTSLAGYVADKSLHLAFLTLTAAGVMCITCVALLMGETTRRASAEVAKSGH